MSKFLTEVPRVLLGFIFFAFGLAGLLHLLPPQQMEGAAALYMTGLSGTYLLTLVKLTEVAAGALLLSNRFVPLALVIIAPVTVNIVGFHLFYAPSGLVLPALMVAAQVSIAWKHRAAFAGLFTAKASAEGARELRAVAPVSA